VIPDAFPPAYFSRRDESDDRLFYQALPTAEYLDIRAHRALGDLLLELLRPGGAILDLMGGRQSHLPAGLGPRRVVGLGLNAVDMAQNTQLDEFVVRDLNREPILPFGAAEFDAVLCTAAIQYLTRPVPVFREVNRLLRPGGRFVVSFSRGCFPRKAIAIWLATTMRQRRALVARYFEVSGNWQDLGGRRLLPADASTTPDELQAIWGRKPVVQIRAPSPIQPTDFPAPATAKNGPAAGSRQPRR
jgi:SAM-dependent methyltransferase